MLVLPKGNATVCRSATRRPAAKLVYGMLDSFIERIHADCFTYYARQDKLISGRWENTATASGSHRFSAFDDVFRLRHVALVSGAPAAHARY